MEGGGIFRRTFLTACLTSTGRAFHFSYTYRNIFFRIWCSRNYSEMISSNTTKLRRKMRKYENIIMKDYGIRLCQRPTKVLIICNGGLVNGIDQGIIFEKFSKFGPIENIVMIPDKSYCFVLFKEINSAEKAYNSLNNKDMCPLMRGPVFLVFAEKIPDSLNIEINFNDKPPGLFVIEDFISEEDESKLLKLVENDTKQSLETRPSELKNRRVCHFGYEFNYNSNNVYMNTPLKEIPKELDFLWEKLLKISPELGLKLNFKPDQLTINTYQQGQGIPPHVDTHSAFEDPIISLSLQSSVVMEFKNSEGKCVHILLPSRSLCVMSGEARYGWTHGISTRKSDIIPAANGGYTLQFRKERTSFTFRKIRQCDCHCEFPHFCDTRLKSKSATHSCSDLEENAAAKLEESYVHKVYQKISDHFSETRHKPWPNVLKFVQSLPAGSILVDVGCGNGKYFSENTRNFEIGLDASFSLLDVCKRRGFECFTSNCLHIPLKDNIADGCISIAVIHHLVTEERRKRAITEIIRILKKNGRALIYVWAKNQERLNKKSSYLKQRTRKAEVDAFEQKKIIFDEVSDNLTLPVHTNRTNFAHNDLLVPWKLKEKGSGRDASKEDPVYLRYYHVFEDDELKNLCSKLENVEIDDYYYDQGNWCILLKKR